MGSNEKFCLRWNDFESNISVAFRELRDEKDFFDVTLACDDSQVQAHKVILSACSPFFRNVLKKNPHQHPLLYLKGVKFKELVSVLNFMYMGEVNVAQEELNSFLAVAEELRVKGLTQGNAESSGQKSAEKSGRGGRDPQPSSHDRDSGQPPAKKSRSSAAPSSSAQSHHSNVPVVGDDEIQEVVPVKSEPRDQAPPRDTESHHHHQQQQQQQHQQYDNQQGTVALQEYQDDGYDYEGYEEGYDDGTNYDTSGIQQQGADGNKVLRHLQRSNAASCAEIRKPAASVAVPASTPTPPGMHLPPPSPRRSMANMVVTRPSAPPPPALVNLPPALTTLPPAPPLKLGTNNCAGQPSAPPPPPPGTGNILIKEELDLATPGQERTLDDDDGDDPDSDCETRWDVEMESRISVDLNLFVCMACAGSKYSSKQKLNIISHIRTKHLKDFGGFVCELCPLVFNKRRNFERHMQRRHNVLTVSTENVKSEESIAE